MKTTETSDNVDLKVAKGFGEEWSQFTQEGLSEIDKKKIFEDYFSIFPWGALPKDGGKGADLGCGSGRWASLVAPRVKELHCIDAAEAALAVAKRNLKKHKNVKFKHTSVGKLPFEDNSLDFAYSLGVLHHLPDTEAAVKSIARKLKPGAPFLLYLYYAFDNRPAWYRGLWQLSETGRWSISRLPFRLRYVVSQAIAATVYLPLARSARIMDKAGKMPASWPLAYYRNKEFYVMRTDALDRFGTRLEKRFTKAEITHMLHRAGFDHIRFSDRAPYWVAIGLKNNDLCPK